MALLSEQDRQTVRGHLAVIEEPVRLLFFTQTFGAPDTVASTPTLPLPTGRSS